MKHEIDAFIILNTRVVVKPKLLYVH